MALQPSVQLVRLADLLDESFWFYRRNLTPLLLIAALGSVPLALLEVIVAASNPDIGSGLASLRDTQFWIDVVLRLGNTSDTSDVLSLFDFVLQPLATAALIWAITQRYAGRAIDVGGSVAVAAHRLLALIGAEMVRALVLVPAFIPAMLCFLIINALWADRAIAAVFGTSRAGIDAGLLGIGLLAALSLLLPLAVAVRLGFVTQGLLLERLGPLGSIAYSWKLTRGRFWRVCAAVTVIWLLTTLVARAPAALLSQLLIVALGSSFGAMIAPVVAAAGQVVALSFGTCASTLLYVALALSQRSPAPVPPTENDPAPLLATVEPPVASG